MITKIGIVAGEIWQLLDNSGVTSLEMLKTKIDRPEPLILMSLGWLSREGHIVLEKEGDDFKVNLREKEAEEVKS